MLIYILRFQQKHKTINNAVRDINQLRNYLITKINKLNTYFCICTLNPPIYK